MSHQSHTTRNILLILGILILTVLFFVFRPVQKAEVPLATQTKELSPQNVAVTTEKIGASSRIGIKAYTSSINKPTVSGLENKNIERHINTQIKDALADIQKEYIDELTQWDIGSSKDTSTLSINATSSVVDNKYVAIRLSIGSFLAESAHPSTREVTLNFTLDTGKLLSLSDILKGDYLKTLATYCKQVLVQKLGASGSTPSQDEIDQYVSYFGAGSDASEENYKNFMITSDGIDVVFDQYQVAAGYEGAQVVSVPRNVLKEVMQKSDF